MFFNYLKTAKLVQQVTIPMYQINYCRKGACLITIPQLGKKPGFEVSLPTIHRHCLSDAKRYKLQFGSLGCFPKSPSW